MHARRILFVSYTSDWTGPTRSLWLLLNALRKEYSIGVALPGRGAFSTAVAESGIAVHEFADLGRGCIGPLFHTIRKHPYDLVYGNSSHGSSRNALIAARLARRPFICHVREMGHGKSWRTLGFLRFANRVVAVSDACAQSISHIVPAAKLRVVHNGVPAGREDIAQARQLLRDRFGFDEPAFVVLALGHVCERKGQLAAVQAVERLRAVRPEIRLILIGALDRDAAYVQQLQHYISSRNLADLVQFAGYIPDAWQLLNGADVLLHTPVADPHPRAVLEGMAAGLPIVAYATDGVAESIVDEESGMLAPPGDLDALVGKLDRLAGDRALRLQLGAAARSRALDRFTVRQTAEGIEHVIRSVL